MATTLHYLYRMSYYGTVIRQAEISDYEAIAAIRDVLALDVSRLDDKGYVAAIEQTGFLVPVDIRPSDFEEHVSDYIVGEVDGRVVGFLRVDDAQEMAPNEVPRWVNSTMEAKYREMPHANIGKVAVLPTVGKRGVASAMLAEAEQRSRDRGARHLFSFIVGCKPPTNYPSIGFHTKNGFQVAAPIEPQEAYGISNYLVTLYEKRLS